MADVIRNIETEIEGWRVVLSNTSKKSCQAWNYANGALDALIRLKRILRSGDQ